MQIIPALLIVLAQLRGQGTRADSAYARDVLSRALETYRQVSAETGQSHLDERFIEQLGVWGMKEQVWSMSLQRDSLIMQSSHGREAWLTGRLLANLYAKNDTIGTEARIATLPVAVRDDALRFLSMTLRCNRRAAAERLRSQIQDRYKRARSLADGAHPCSANDSARARAELRAAIELVRDDSLQRVASEARYWLQQLKRLGGEVSVEDLVQAHQREVRDRNAGLDRAATSLIQAGDRARALPLLDTLLARATRITPRPHGYLARLHEQRGTKADSALARALRDSAKLQQPVFVPDSAQQAMMRRHNADSQLREAIDKFDRVSTGTTINGALLSGDSVGILITAAGLMRHRNMYPTPGRSADTPSVAQLEYAEFLYNAMWQASTRMPAGARDSVRVTLVALLASYDEARALTVARSQLRITRMRDRATAEAVSALVRTDADLAASAAAPLQDRQARNIAFLALTERAVAGGRLAAALRYADRTVDGAARVRAQYAVANALFAADSISAARYRVVALLAHLDPIWRCEGYCGAVPVNNSVLVPEFPGMSRNLIGNVVLLAFRTGAADALRTWANTRVTAEARAAAGLALSEGWARHRLGIHTMYPMH